MITDQLEQTPDHITKSERKTILIARLVWGYILLNHFYVYYVQMSPDSIKPLENPIPELLAYVGAATLFVGSFFIRKWLANFIKHSRVRIVLPYILQWMLLEGISILGLMLSSVNHSQVIYHCFVGLNTLGLILAFPRRREP